MQQVSQPRGRIVGWWVGVAWTSLAWSQLAGAAGISLDVEGVLAWQQRNDVQSPSDATASRFALDDITGDGPVAGPRLQLAIPAGARFGGDRAEWRFLAAPLRIERNGSTPVALRFEGSRFTPGALRAGYRFDSWRATWRYRWIDRPDLTIRLGVTAKIRDAQIELRQGSVVARKKNTGFVPLLHATLDKPLGTQWSVSADIDALGGGPGYAIDAGLRLVRELEAGWSVSAGVRVLDGGADSDEVYAFARVTSVTVGVSKRFD